MRTLVDNLQAESPRPRFIIVMALDVDHDDIYEDDDDIEG